MSKINLKLIYSYLILQNCLVMLLSSKNDNILFWFGWGNLEIIIKELQYLLYQIILLTSNMIVNKLVITWQTGKLYELLKISNANIFGYNTYPRERTTSALLLKVVQIMHIARQR